MDGGSLTSDDAGYLRLGAGDLELASNDTLHVGARAMNAVRIRASHTVHTRHCI